MANIFNDFYKKKVEDIVGQIPKNLGSPTNKLNNRMYELKGVHANPNKMTLKRTSIKEVHQINDELNNSMATGLDNILNTFIKYGKDILAPHI